MPLSDCRVIFQGDGPLLSAKSAGGALAHVFDAFRVRTASRSEWVADACDVRIIRHHMRQSIHANIGGYSVADPIVCAERCTCDWASTVGVIAEAQRAGAIILDLHHEIHAQSITCQQIGAEIPIAAAVITELNGRQRLLRITGQDFRCGSARIRDRNDLGQRSARQPRSKARWNRVRWRWVAAIGYDNGLELRWRRHWSE